MIADEVQLDSHLRFLEELLKLASDSWAKAREPTRIVIGHCDDLKVFVTAVANGYYLIVETVQALQSNRAVDVYGFFPIKLSAQLRFLLTPHFLEECSPHLKSRLSS